MIVPSYRPTVQPPEGNTCTKRDPQSNLNVTTVGLVFRATRPMQKYMYKYRRVCCPTREVTGGGYGLDAGIIVPDLGLVLLA
jgi:hypothetical protein